MRLKGIKEKQIIPFNVLEKRFISAYLNRLITPLYNNGVDFFWVDYYPKERKKHFNHKVSNKS